MSGIASLKGTADSVADGPGIAERSPVSAFDVSAFDVSGPNICCMTSSTSKSVDMLKLMKFCVGGDGI